MEKKTGFNKEWILPIIALLFLVVCIVVVKPWKRTERKMIENSIRGSEFNAISFSSYTMHGRQSPDNKQSN